MNENDETIRAALAREETGLLSQLDEPPLFTQVMATFRGRKRFLVLFSFAIGLAFFALVVTSVLLFFRTESPREMIAWACVFGLGVVATGLLKLWYFMELNKYVLLREIKRLELQVARLSDRLMKSA